MTRPQIIAALGVVLGAVAAAYFGFIAAKPDEFARVMMSRGYEKRGWTQERLARRVRVLGSLGVVLGLAAILLAIVKFVG